MNSKLGYMWSHVVFLILALIPTLILCKKKEDNDYKDEDYKFAVNALTVVLVVVLSVLSGFLSFILSAYSSIDELILESKSRSGTSEEREQVIHFISIGK